MRFGLLGPLALFDDEGAPVPVSGARLRVLLAMLLLQANTPVAAETLAEAVWDGAPPPAAAQTLRSHLARLRRALGAEGVRVVARDPGYVIRVQPGELDVLEFEQQCRRAGSALARCAWVQAADAADRALALWRGEPLLDVPAQVLREKFAPRLAQVRLQVLEDRTEAELRLGQYERLVPQLRELTAAHPLREHFHAQLVTALGGTGRRAEALAAYQDARRVLVEELGVEPGPRLRDVHGRVLAGEDPQPTATPHAEPSNAAVGTVPRQLPAAPGHFTGRHDELAQLTALADAAGGPGGTVVISAIDGTAGIGKTALAVHWAHQVAGQFPDGQLYVNLRGYDPGRPMPAADALARFLRSLGVPGTDIPPDEDERASQYRSLLAGRRMLVVLDNAGAAEQVRPLLPGAPTCVVVVTSRDGLAGLVARDAARRIDLGMLPPAEAVALLRALIGGRVDADLDAAATLVHLCCGLPLALRVAAELAAARPAARLADLAGELADQQHRLDLLDAAGDPRTAVRAVFSWSCRYLDVEAARAFRLLSLHPGPDFDGYAAAALTGTSIQQASHLLDVLARACLVQTGGQGRYGMHDLLRVYAHELADAQDNPHEQQAALTRLFDHYLYTAAAAMDVTFPAESDRRPRVTPPAGPCPEVTSSTAAWTWLDTERPTLAAVVAHAAASGWPNHATRLAATVFRYLEAGGYYLEIVAIHDHARRAACDIGDRGAEAQALRGLVVVDLRQGRYQQAADRLDQLLVVYRETGDQAGEAATFGNLGITGFLQGRYSQATSHLRHAMAVYREIGDRVGTARQFCNLGLVELRLGNYHQAGEHLDQALAISCETGNQPTEAYALSNLGVASLRLGDYQQASDHLERALAVCRDSGNRDCAAYTLGNLGVLMSRMGNHQQAREHVEQALTMCRETNDRSSEAEALNNLGEVLRTAERPGDARTHHATALRLASLIDDKYEQARAHNGLAHSYHTTGDLGEARQHWQQALAIYTSLGTPEAHHVRAQLDILASQREP